MRSGHGVSPTTLDPSPPRPSPGRSFLHGYSFGKMQAKRLARGEEALVANPKAD